MWRKIFAVLTGIVAATLISMGFESINNRRFPLPQNVDPADHEAMSEYAQTLPSSALILLVLGWALGAFVCGMLVRLISQSRDKTPAYIAGLFLTTAGIVDIFMLPRPVWFIVTGIVVFIPLSLAGHWVAGKFSK